MGDIENFWEQRSRRFGVSMPGVLIKSAPEAINLHLHKWMLEQISAVIPSGQRIKMLDLGCGYGRLSKPLLERFPDITTFGIDISKTFVDFYNQQLTPRGKAVKGNIIKLPFKSHYFDAVFMVTTLMYIISSRDQEKAVAEIFRVLKPGGSFVVIERSPIGYTLFTLGGLVSKIRGRKYSEITAVSFNPNDLSSLLTKKGGQMNKMRGIPLFTLMFPLLLVLTIISGNLGKILLLVVEAVDQKFGWLITPSLYISYIGTKHE